MLRKHTFGQSDRGPSRGDWLQCQTRRLLLLIETPTQINCNTDKGH